MEIIKQYSSVGAGQLFRVMIKTETFIHTLAHFKMLSIEAMNDFGLDTLPDVDIEKYQNGTWGIEFTLSSEEKIPNGYVEVNRLPMVAG